MKLAIFSYTIDLLHTTLKILLKIFPEDEK